MRFRTAAAAILLVASVPGSAQFQRPTQRFQIRVASTPSECLTLDRGFLFRLPYAKHVPCPAGDPRAARNFQWDFESLGGNLFRIGHVPTFRCAAVADGVIFGLPAIDLLPCNDAEPRQRTFFFVDRRPNGTFLIRSMRNKCVYWDSSYVGSQMVERPCEAVMTFILVPA